MLCGNEFARHSYFYLLVLATVARVVFIRLAVFMPTAAGGQLEGSQAA
jgi:hypothetical protein